MLNLRFLTTFKDPKKFIEDGIQFLKKHAKDKKVFCALSGGIDSSTAYLLLEKAEINVFPVFIDHGLMRIIRGIEEREHVKKLFPDVHILDIREQFLPQIYGEGDAEGKRKLFKKAYSDTISKVIKEEACDLLADGTILPDIEESFGIKISDLKESMSLEDELALKSQHQTGFVKSQHNVEIEYDVEATIQPVASLIKDQVRQVLDFLGMPQELVYRKAFPGPALSARIVGPVTAENLAFEKQIHDLVESTVDDYYIQKFGKPMIINNSGMQEPFQVFAATIEDVLNTKVTGLREGKRTYELPLCVRTKWDYQKLVQLASNIKEYARVFYELGINSSGRFDVVIRVINSKDARTATITNLPIKLIREIRDKLLQFPETKNVFIDVTPKPPATIEYV